MIYIFDIMLNFNTKLYNFYEWKEQDELINYKKIPLFKINSTLMNDIFKNNIKIDNVFLKVLKGKNEYNNYSVIFTDSKECIALIFNEEGTITKRSSLLVDDELEVLELSKTLKPLVLEYQKINKLVYSNHSRIEDDLKEKLIKEVNDIKDIGLIKYLNYELLNINSIDKENLIKLIKNGNYWDNKNIMSNLIEVLSII